MINFMGDDRSVFSNLFWEIWFFYGFVIFGYVENIGIFLVVFFFNFRILILKDVNNVLYFFYLFYNGFLIMVILNCLNCCMF